MAKLVDALDLGSGAARRVGSSPTIRTKLRGGGKVSYWSHKSVISGFDSHLRVQTICVERCRFESYMLLALGIKGR